MTCWGSDSADAQSTVPTSLGTIVEVNSGGFHTCALDETGAVTCWGDNIISLAVKGEFDDCQRLAKELFADTETSKRFNLCSANSINIGRLLPQSIYYAASSLQHYRATGSKPGFIVPTGNLGNALACIMARKMGLPIGEIVLATNANKIIADFLEGSQWLPRDSIPTLASAMDVGNPSNMERLRNLIGEADALNELVRVFSASDEDIEAHIKHIHSSYGITICPHSATASYAYHQLSQTERQDVDWIIVATAHPAKFESIVEPLIGAEIALPEALLAIQSKPSRPVNIDANMDSLQSALNERFHLDAGHLAGDK